MSKIVDSHTLIDKDAGLSSPSGLICDDKNRNLWVVDMGNRRLVCFDLVRRYFLAIDVNTVFREPLAITRLGGHLVVSDALSNTIWIRQTDRTWELLVAPDALFPSLCFPGSVAADQWGNLYFTDFHHDRICCRNRAGEVSVLEGIPCRQPFGIFVWNTQLFITDTAGGRVLCYCLKGGCCTGTIEEVPPGFWPISVTADAEGDLYISTVRTIYLYRRIRGKLERLLDTTLWKSLHGTKLGHIGAMAALADGVLTFSDTLRNEVYSLHIQK